MCVLKSKNMDSSFVTGYNKKFRVMAKVYTKEKKKKINQYKIVTE